ncbi:hypothetical protein BDR26DRAFT_948486 [Obelidium mucronatum]|nr:hypothetical protein BDR26DRAFT_948486 [Obelidium mucronatum]
MINKKSETISHKELGDRSRRIPGVGFEAASAVPRKSRKSMKKYLTQNPSASNMGVPCISSIGNFPDSMSYRVDQVLFGSFVSMSDILTYQLQSNGETIKMPGTNAEVVNAIPLFEDPRLAKFYCQYAPKLLEFTCSIGMRRLIADVPMSFGYSVLAGFWRMVELIETNKTELCAKILVCLGESLQVTVGGYVKHILPFFDQKALAAKSAVVGEGGFCFDLGGNGISNCLYPIMHALQSEDKDDFMKLSLPAALRALYSFEVWVAIRKLYRHQEKSNEAIQEMFQKLFCVDLESSRLVPTPLFEADHETPLFNDTFKVNEAYFEELRQKFYYVDGIHLMGPVLSIVADKSLNLVDKIKLLQTTLPKPTPERMSTALNLSYDFKTFQVYTVAQALLYPTKSTRIDDETKQSILPDVGGNPSTTGPQMIQKRIREMHSERYTQDLKLKASQEHALLTKELVDRMIATDNLNEFCNLFRDGLTRGNGPTPSKAQILNPASPGFSDLTTQLLSLEATIPCQVPKARILLLGRMPIRKHRNEETGRLVWNNGNVFGFADIPKFEALYNRYGMVDSWMDDLKEFNERRKHVYREGRENRHGHSNGKVSYWGLGYSSMREMREKVSEEILREYLVAHVGCCVDVTAKE